MCREQEVVESHRRLRRLRVSVGILRFDGWRVEERGGGEGIACEAEYVESGKVDGEAERRFPEIVLYGLWVEGSAPRQKLC